VTKASLPLFIKHVNKEDPLYNPPSHKRLRILLRSRPVKLATGACVARVRASLSVTVRTLSSKALLDLADGETEGTWKASLKK